MFAIKKLAELQSGQRRRKIILLLAAFERALLAVGSGQERLTDADFVELCRLAADDPKITNEEKERITLLAKSFAESASGHNDAASADALRLRLCNTARNALLKAAGTFPAEWDFIHQESSMPAAAQRRCHEGVCAFLEDIRSPFNVGSIFRTAEAFGAEWLYLSPLCAPATHPRAVRSAMGSVDYIAWETKPLDELPADAELFALETGGTPIDEFSFPKRGIVIVGSEELGVSPEALERARKRVSIPLIGLKASLNVGVAFGILMEAWTRSLILR